MDRLVKVGPSAVSTDLVPGRSERPTEPDRDTASGIHREVYTPRGILGRSSSSRPIVDSQPSRTNAQDGGRRQKEAKKWPVCGVHKRVNEQRPPRTDIAPKVQLMYRQKVVTRAISYSRTRSRAAAESGVGSVRSEVS